jgi:hypothetical protein
MPRRVLALAIAIAPLACGPPPAERKPIAEEKIGTIEAIESKKPPDASSPTPSASSTSVTSVPVPDVPDQPDTSAKVADLCPPKGRKPDLSKLASNRCRDKRPSRQVLLAELRGLEQLVASAPAGAPDREQNLIKLAVGYAQLECALATACTSKERDTPSLSDDIPLSEARRKTEAQCASLRSEFPKSKRQCP